MTLFTRSFLLIALLILASAAATFQLYRVYEREPRARELAQQTVSIVNLTRAALVNADPVLRRNLLIEINEREGIRLAPRHRRRDAAAAARRRAVRRIVLAERVQHRARASRPASPTRATACAGFWVSFTIDERRVLGDAAARALRAGVRPGSGWAAGSPCCGLALAGAWLIASTLSRPLGAIAAAAARSRPRARARAARRNRPARDAHRVARLQPHGGRPRAPWSASAPWCWPASRTTCARRCRACAWRSR